MGAKAQHPIYAPGVSQQIRDEYETVKNERDAWISAHASTETDAERWQVRAEELEVQLAEFVRFVQDARPLLGLSVANSLGARADRLLNDLPGSV